MIISSFFFAKLSPTHNHTVNIYLLTPFFYIDILIKKKYIDERKFYEKRNIFL